MGQKLHFATPRIFAVDKAADVVEGALLYRSGAQFPGLPRLTDESVCPTLFIYLTGGEARATDDP
jgi:hypothetical protein